MAGNQYATWVERVEKERKSLHKHLTLHQTADVRRSGILPSEPGSEDNPDPYDSVPPLHGMHRTPHTVSLPKIDGMRVGTGASRPGTHSTVRSAVTRSLRSSGSVGKLGSDRTSSTLTGLTTASLRREVAEAVQMEVAKVVQPLKDKLQSEQMTRQKLEDMLSSQQPVAGAVSGRQRLEQMLKKAKGAD
eukprot:TRINITY_DN94824_c0_g1_i1.p1 TRINITY_DN94824_c0_g1~~TRINITY_DN94824_c0_g1_i1.p1  ORF type:complete len:189 (+),score=33.29 TRINITY_DN94824_c0_g1_i1:103-669(+)